MANNGITPDGRDWLLCAMDPFHDFEHPVSGYPDADASKTVVSCYQTAYDIAKPAGLPNAPWDCHVYSLPTAQSTLKLIGYDMVAPGSMHVANNNSDYNFGMMNVACNVAGGPLFRNSPTIVSPGMPTFTNHIIPTPDGVAAGNSRVVGFGFEVVNTTASLHKQGAVTTYRMPQMTGVASLALETGNWTGMMPVHSFQAPPSFVADATLLGGTRQWEAAEGAYVVGTQSSVQNPLVFESYHAMAISPFSLAQSNFALLGKIDLAGVANAPPAVSRLVAGENKLLPVNTSGAMLTGLSPETTLRVKVRVYVESAPTWSYPELAVLATPSAAYDVHALEVYSRAMAALPVAVPVGENAAGDWFRRICSVVIGAAGPLGLALAPFYPGAPMVAQQVANVAKGVRDAIPEERAEKRTPKGGGNTLKPKRSSLPTKQKPAPRSRE